MLVTADQHEGGSSTSSVAGDHDTSEEHRLGLIGRDPMGPKLVLAHVCKHEFQDPDPRH
jgi:hypothetical protein